MRSVHNRTYRECPGCGLIMMDRTGVRSTNIVSVGWEKDPEGSNGVMEVEFKAGVVYQYDDVPEWLYQSLIYSPSPGRFLLTNIVAAYEGQRIA